MDAIITATSGCRSLAWRWVVSVDLWKINWFLMMHSIVRNLLLFQFMNLPHSNI
ncbi:hypothetical protein PanWU01x14_322970 [Parasponia andersonii]|uniref:Uncharacterized protein n=1 Tax=Parasponia andersonii TaxID=3476 RepID=A0A2P5AKU5_PARAD|nr:hypothetical protein PanWU01x14_322970 [Parasponia andersonii]